jgi:nucleoid DNA-binding protein
MSLPAIKRDDFVRHFAQHADLTYVEAERAYTALIRLVENAVASKQPINLGRVGVLEPVCLKPRRVTMGFKREGSRMVRCRREFYLGVRTRFVFKLHRAFGRSHGLVP